MSKILTSTWSLILKIVITVATAVLGVITGSSFSS
ncbi:smalltalk protein [Xylanibacter oryzae]|nr:smalltalk protein [Xylanibacter oryzae]